MRARLFPLCALMVAGSFAALAQSASAVPEKIACSQHSERNAYHKKALWNGYEVRLGPNSDPEAVEEKCIAQVYDGQGREVFNLSGYSVNLDEDDTGEDFDANGDPEVVFASDSGGGNHCCWAYHILSLSPTAHQLFEIDQPAHFEKDPQGEILIWERRPGTMKYTSMARTPFAERVFRVTGSRLMDVTAQFCSKIQAPGNEDFDEQTRVLTAESMKQLQSDAAGWDREEVVSALLSRALQHVFCGQYKDAIADLDRWPEAGRAKMKADFADSIKRDFPDFAARLTK